MLILLEQILYLIVPQLKFLVRKVPFMMLIFKTFYRNCHHWAISANPIRQHIYCYLQCTRIDEQ